MPVTVTVFVPDVSEDGETFPVPGTAYGMLIAVLVPPPGEGFMRVMATEPVWPAGSVTTPLTSPVATVVVATGVPLTKMVVPGTSTIPHTWIGVEAAVSDVGLKPVISGTGLVS